jgi:hypothetical protein
VIPHQLETETSMKGHPELGAQDPERKNSPVAWETDEDVETLRESIPDEAACYFNDRAYAHDTVVGSGGVLLRCDHGIWVPAGPAESAKP